MQYQPAPSLLGCPVEVCRSIFSFLDRVDFINLCLVHRNLRALAEPHLYAKIRLKWDGNPYERKPDPHPITSLLRSLLPRAQLATYVRTVSLVSFGRHHSWDKRRANKILATEDSLEGPLAFVRKAVVPYREIWLEELANGTMDAFVAVLLSQPLNLTFLSIDGDFLYESTFLGLVFRTMILEPNAYERGLQLDVRHLETVSLQTFYKKFRFYNDASNTEHLLSFFYLPSVKQLFASIDHPTIFSWPATLPPCPSSLQSLKLEYIREPYIGQTLSVTNNLQYLRFNWYFLEELYGPQYRTRGLDLAQITESLSYVRETLIELVISAINDNDPDPLSLSIRGSMKGLAEFRNLAKLTVPFIFLVGTWSIDLTKRIETYLPQSLESLIMTGDLASNDECEWWDDDNDMFSILEPWLSIYQASTPRLQDVEVPVEQTHENLAYAQKLSGLTNGAVKVRLEQAEPAYSSRGTGRGRSRPTWYDPICSNTCQGS